VRKNRIERPWGKRAAQTAEKGGGTEAGHTFSKEVRASEGKRGRGYESLQRASKEVGQRIARNLVLKKKKLGFFPGK